MITKKIIIFLLIFILFTYGCTRVVGNVVRENEISKEEIISAASRAIRKEYRGYPYIAYTPKKIGSYWVVPTMVDQMHYVWINSDGSVVCVNKDENQPVNCL